MANYRVIMAGDVVGEPGLAVLEAALPGLIAEYRADFVVVNGENAAAGFGITEPELRRILKSGADVVTSGNHVWEKRDFLPVMDAEKHILRPGNYPEGSPGRGWVKIEKENVSWLVINLQGREQMAPIDCPFKTFDAVFAAYTAQNESTETPQPGKVLTLIDFHAESSAEKEAMAYYVDGRASLVAGTHTHVQTADERVLPQGTGYITDLGMTGVTQSIIGMDTAICLERARRQVLYRMECAQGAASFQGIAAEIDGVTGKTISITRIQRQL